MSNEFQDNLSFDDMPDAEGMFDSQLSLPISTGRRTVTLAHIIKRDGRREPFDSSKIAEAIRRAADAAGTKEPDMPNSIAAAVTIYLAKRVDGESATADQVSDAVERVLIQMALADVALTYARYRDRRTRIRRLRRGDMRALLNELEEARHEREASTTLDASLHVRTSQDRIVGWDRQRIIEALQTETQLDEARATLIAAEVEQQIHDAGISVLTTPLIRELVGAKLIEHGLVEENEQQRRLGVPLYDASRIIRGATPETIGHDPNRSDQMLARAVKKEYALTEVFSHQVTQAHLTGDIHLNGLPVVDRLHSGDHTLAYLATHGIRLSGGRNFAHPPNHPETLLAQMVKYSDALDALFADTIGWYAVNYMAAPFVQSLSDEELRQFAEMLIFECAYRHAPAQDERSPIKISLFWNAPPNIADATAIGPASSEDTATYKDHDLTARRLAWALLDVFKKGGVNGVDFPAPIIDIVLDERVFKTFEGADYLRHAAATALQRTFLQFVFARRDEDTDIALQPVWHPRDVVWHRIAFNLPRAALNATDEPGLFSHLDRLCALAIAAHTQKRDFIEMLLDPIGNAPLATMALEHDGHPYLASEEGLFTVDIDGLYECAQIMCGIDAAAMQPRLRFMENLLRHLAHALKRHANKADLRCCLSANSSPFISRRFATLDATVFPRLLQNIVKTEIQTQALTYTTGVSLPDDLGMSPLEIARTEGTLHAHLGEQQFSNITLPLRNTSKTALADLLRMLLHQTTCDGVILSK